MVYEVLSTLAMPLLGGIAWAFRLEGRLNTAIQRHDDLKELINTRFDDVAYRLERVEEALTKKR